MACDCGGSQSTSNVTFEFEVDETKEVVTFQSRVTTVLWQGERRVKVYDSVVYRVNVNDFEEWKRNGYTQFSIIP